MDVGHGELAARPGKPVCHGHDSGFLSAQDVPHVRKPRQCRHERELCGAWVAEKVGDALVGEQ